jgi:branched-chain amino acid transport system ATP-binding protein/nonpolar-amino-acid-transporting ATPase
MLRVTQANAGYGHMQVLHQLDIDVAHNEAVAIVGANGAGKSTLVRAILGLLPLMAGNIRFDDVDISRKPAHLRVDDGIAVVLETRGLFGKLTVAEHLRLSEHAGKRAPRPADFARISMDEVLNLFPIVKERLASRVELLSGGQQQMLAVARSLLLQPRLLVLDELTTGLAPKVVQEIIEALGKLRARGLSLLIVEQNVKLAATMTDRAYIMSLGRVVHHVGRGEWERTLANETISQAYLHG